jgi:hypothetical protein
MAAADSELTACAAEGCEVLCRGRTCSASCRSKVWKLENNYRDRRAPQKRSEHSQRRKSRPSRTRYAVVQVRGSVAEVLAFDSGKGKRAVERAFGIADRPELEAVAARHLPSAIVGGA